MAVGRAAKACYNTDIRSNISTAMSPLEKAIYRGGTEITENTKYLEAQLIYADISQTSVSSVSPW